MQLAVLRAVRAEKHGEFQLAGAIANGSVERQLRPGAPRPRRVGVLGPTSISTSSLSSEHAPFLCVVNRSKKAFASAACRERAGASSRGQQRIGLNRAD
jgi:hypothetical protein